MYRKQSCNGGYSCVACSHGKGFAVDHAKYSNKWRASLTRGSDDEMPIKKPEGASGLSGPARGARTSDEWILYPTLLEFLTEAQYEDGSNRELPTLLVFSEGGAWKGCLGDRDNDRNAFISSASITGLLVIFEEKLKESSLDWRPKGGKGKRK